jgi:hypothetical protein
MNLLAASCGVSDHDVRPSLDGRGIEGRVKYPPCIVITPT